MKIFQFFTFSSAWEPGSKSAVPEDAGTHGRNGPDVQTREPPTGEGLQYLPGLSGSTATWSARHGLLMVSSLKSIFFVCVCVCAIKAIGESPVIKASIELKRG